MADGMQINTAELDKLGADIGRVAASGTKFFEQAIKGTALGVKKAWQERLKGSDWVPSGPYAITFDVEVTRAGIEAEIGPELGRRQASIVGILETGTPTTGARGFGLRALQANVEDFERGIDRALDDALRASGL